MGSQPGCKRGGPWPESKKVVNSKVVLVVGGSGRVAQNIRHLWPGRWKEVSAAENPGIQLARGHCEAAHVVNGPPRGLETEGLFQGHGWDKGGVDWADPFLPSTGTGWCFRRNLEAKTTALSCWRRPRPAQQRKSDGRNGPRVTRTCTRHTRADAEGQGPQASHQIAIENSLVSSSWAATNTAPRCPGSGDISRRRMMRSLSALARRHTGQRGRKKE